MKSFLSVFAGLLLVYYYINDQYRKPCNSEFLYYGKGEKCYYNYCKRCGTLVAEYSKPNEHVDLNDNTLHISWNCCSCSSLLEERIFNKDEYIFKHKTNKINFDEIKEEWFKCLLESIYVFVIGSLTVYTLL